MINEKNEVIKTLDGQCEVLKSKLKEHIDEVHKAEVTISKSTHVVNSLTVVHNNKIEENKELQIKIDELKCGHIE